MTSFDPYRTTGAAAGDRTWGLSTRTRLQYAMGPALVAVIVVTFLSSMGADRVAGWGGGWLQWAFAALLLSGVLSFSVDIVRTAHRVTLRRDGTLEMARPFGTARVRVDQVRAMRVSRFDQNGHGAIRLHTDQGVHRVHRGLEDLDGMVEVLRERNPRMELPGI